MNDDRDFSLLKNRFTAAARTEWDALVDADRTEPNLEAIAAYIDNKLDAANIDYVARHIAQSPRAWEVLQTMLEPGQSLPQVDDSRRTILKRPFFERFDSRNVFALAASVLLAVSLGYIGWQTNERRLVDAQRLRADRELVQAIKRNVESVAAEYSPPVFVGSSDPQATLAALKKTIAGGFRGPDASEHERLTAAAAEAQKSIALAAKSFPEESLSFRLEEVAVLIAAGKLAEAEGVLKALQADHGSDPRVGNARGAWLVHQARSLTQLQAEPLLAEAEKLLESVALDEPAAWLNLFELYDLRRDRVKAAEAVRNYAKVAENKEISDFVEQRFGESRK